MKKIVYFIAVLLLLGVWGCINKNRPVELDENALLEKEMDDYYNSLPDTITVNTPNGYKKAEKCSGDKYVVGFNNARYWYNKNGEVIDSFIIYGSEVRQEVENTNSSEYYYHIIELFEEQDISTLQQIVEFAEKNKPTNKVLKENLNKKGPYSIYFNGKENFDTIIYGIRYVSNKVN